MSKTTEETKSRAVTKFEGLLPVGQVADYGEHAGAGMGATLDEMQIPFVRLLQKDSKECIKGEAKFIEGATPGKLLNMATGELTDELAIVPVQKRAIYVEWVPLDKGGGFVGTHEVNSPVIAEATEAAKKADPKAKYPALKSKDGNDIVYTIELFAIVATPDLRECVGFVVIPFSGSKHRVIRGYVTKINMMPKSQQAALYSFVARLSSFDDKNKQGRFSNYKLEPITGDVRSSRIGVEHPLFQAAVGLKKALEAGAAKANYQTAATDEPTGDGDAESGGHF